MFTTVLTIVGFLIIWSWPLILGLELHHYLPPRVEIGNLLFIINYLIVVIVSCVFPVLTDGETVTFSGFSAIPFFYVVFAFFHLLTYPGKLLKSLELGKETSFADYIGYGVFILFWPIGIWFLQPRINKAVSEKLVVEEEK